MAFHFNPGDAETYTLEELLSGRTITGARRLPFPYEFIRGYQEVYRGLYAPHIANMIFHDMDNSSWERLDLWRLYIQRAGPTSRDKNPQIDRDDNTPLHLAAEFGSFEVFRLIIESIEDKRSRNPENMDGLTPLHISARTGNYKLCRLIIESVGDKRGELESTPVGAGGWGWTALHFAASEGHLDICRLLMRYMENKNPPEWRPYSNWRLFRTPLHVAAENGHLEVCRLITESVEDKNPADGDGTTPLDLARRNGFTEIAELFESFGSN